MIFFPWPIAIPCLLVPWLVGVYTILDWIFG